MAATSERLLCALCWACVFSQQLREIEKCGELLFTPRALPFLILSSDHCSSESMAFVTLERVPVVYAEVIVLNGRVGALAVFFLELFVLYEVGASQIGQFAIKN